MRLTRWSRRWPRSKDNLVSLVSLVGLVILAKICIICTLQNFQFYLAHLWTDFQSCFLYNPGFFGGFVPEVQRRRRSVGEEECSMMLIFCSLRIIPLGMRLLINVLV